LYYYLYTFFEFSFFAFFIIGYIESKKTKKLLIIASILFLGFIIYYYTQIPLKKIDAIPIGIETILLYIFIIPYLASQFKKELSFQLHKQFHFWIILGIMFYLAGTFFFNIVGNELNKSEIKRFWFYSYLADILKNLFFTFSIVFYIKEKAILKSKIKSLPNLDFTL
jgi:hypothetical protein